MEKYSLTLWRNPEVTEDKVVAVGASEDPSPRPTKSLELSNIAVSVQDKRCENLCSNLQRQL